VRHAGEIGGGEVEEGDVGVQEQEAWGGIRGDGEEGAGVGCIRGHGGCEFDVMFNWLGRE